MPGFTVATTLSRLPLTSFTAFLQGPETVRETQMHELSIAIDLLAAVEQKLRPGDNRVVRVIVSVGSATGIAPESLCLAFRAIAVGTRAEGTELSVTNTAARSRCVNCGMIFDFEGVIGQCPGCGRLGGKILSGDEVMLRAIEVADV
jgi:hydrogenase nickel incorporation protein HypA/HybF